MAVGLNLKDGKPILLRKEGYAVALWDYDPAGREIVRRFLDAARKPVKADSGRSIVRTDYDHRNLATLESSFDEFDKPALELLMKGESEYEGRDVETRKDQRMQQAASW